MDLRRMRFLNNRLPMAKMRVEIARSKAYKTTAVLTGMPRGSSTTSQVERGAELIEAAETAYKGIVSELKEMREELAPYIKELDTPLEKTAMDMRYMDGVSVREIAFRLNYSEQHIFRVVADAEQKIMSKVN